ncbi:hypothetical protein [Paraburkholderia sp. 40]
MTMTMAMREFDPWDVVEDIADVTKGIVASWPDEGSLIEGLVCRWNSKSKVTRSYELEAT